MRLITGLTKCFDRILTGMVTKLMCALNSQEFTFNWILFYLV